MTYVTEVTNNKIKLSDNTLVKANISRLATPIEPAFALFQRPLYEFTYKYLGERFNYEFISGLLVVSEFNRGWATVSNEYDGALALLLDEIDLTYLGNDYVLPELGLFRNQIPVILEVAFMYKRGVLINHCATEYYYRQTALLMEQYIKENAVEFVKYMFIRQSTGFQSKM